MPERILLVGMMGAGKSTVGRLLARELGWEFRDVDEEVEEESGLSVAELFSRRGEPAFRELEERALESCLAGDADGVVSVGGGAVLSESNRARLAGAGTVVWLRARPETLADRVGDGAGRPLLSGGPERAVQRIERLARDRAALYDAVADVVVDVDGSSAPEVVDRVLAARRGRGERSVP